MNSEIKDNKPLISVVVPVYNTRKYIKRCYKSIEGQTYKNIEIIFVNDGSTDDSLEICERLKKDNGNIVIVNKTNGGLASARNAGIRVANGEYISFVDSDDWIAKDTYEYMISCFKKYDVDLVDIKILQTFSDDPLIQKDDEHIDILTGKDILYHYLYRGLNEKKGAPYSSCRKLYKKTFFEDKSLFFEEGIVNEDICFNYRFLEKCNKVLVSNQIKYFYFQHNISITSGSVKKRDLDLLKVSNDLVNLTKKTKEEKIIELAQMKLARSYFSLLARIAVSGIDDSITNSQELIDCLKKNLKKNILLILKSPMPINRKIMCLLFVVNYNLSRKFIVMFSSIK